MRITKEWLPKLAALGKFVCYGSWVTSIDGRISIRAPMRSDPTWHACIADQCCKDASSLEELVDILVLSNVMEG
jgi:hypothetical protein